MRNRSKQMPGLVLVSCILGAATIWAGYLRLNRFVPGVDEATSNQNTINWPDYKIDINDADASKLALLPGIGSRLAQRIIDYRRSNGRFLALDDLMQVSGIGERSIYRIRRYAEVGDDMTFSIAKHSPAQEKDGEFQQPIQD